MALEKGSRDPATYRVRWIFEGEAGFWRSLEGRFQISPDYNGRTTAQSWKLVDNLHPSNSTGSLLGVRPLKERADYLVQREIAAAEIRAELTNGN